MAVYQSHLNDLGLSQPVPIIDWSQAVERGMNIAAQRRQLQMQAQELDMRKQMLPVQLENEIARTILTREQAATAQFERETMGPLKQAQAIAEIDNQKRATAFNYGDLALKVEQANLDGLRLENERTTLDVGEESRLQSRRNKDMSQSLALRQDSRALQIKALVQDPQAMSNPETWGILYDLYEELLGEYDASLITEFPEGQMASELGQMQKLMGQPVPVGGTPDAPVIMSLGQLMEYSRDRRIAPNLFDSPEQWQNATQHHRMVQHLMNTNKYSRDTATRVLSNMNLVEQNRQMLLELPQTTVPGTEDSVIDDTARRLAPFVNPDRNPGVAASLDLSLIDRPGPIRSLIPIGTPARVANDKISYFGESMRQLIPQVSRTDRAELSALSGFIGRITESTFWRSVTVAKTGRPFSPKRIDWAMEELTSLPLEKRNAASMIAGEMQMAIADMQNADTDAAFYDAQNRIEGHLTVLTRAILRPGFEDRNENLDVPFLNMMSRQAAAHNNVQSLMTRQALIQSAMGTAPQGAPAGQAGAPPLPR